MKTIKYILLLVAIGLVSCDFLEKEPYELTPETYFNDEAELNSFLVGVYSSLMQETFYGNSYPLDHAGGDDLTFYQRSSPLNGIICANANSSTATIMTYWRTLYDGINKANMLIENADKNPEIHIDIRNRVKAEAYCLRSFYYFHLVQGWGDVPFRTEAAQSVEGLSIPRTDRHTIYDQIIEDIINAIPFLPTADSQKQTGTLTQTAAQGILARIYTFRAGEHYRDSKSNAADAPKYWAQAKYWAQEVVKSNLHDLVPHYAQVFVDMSADQYNSTGVRESMWEVEEAGNRINSGNYTAGRIGNVIGFGSGNDYSGSTSLRNYTGMKNPGYSYRFAFASLKLYEMYENQGDTARGNWNIAPFEYDYATSGENEVLGRIYFEGKRPEGLEMADGMPCTDYPDGHAQNSNKTRCAAKYRREYEVVVPKNKNYTPINFPILRYSDVLLMLAEAENEINGPTDLAYQVINKVRERANIQPLSGLDKDEFRDALKDERAMELCFEALRRWDLIRWGEYYSKMNDMVNWTTRTGWNTGHRYAANYYKVSEAYIYFPIPDWEISTNKAITQTPGW